MENTQSAFRLFASKALFVFLLVILTLVIAGGIFIASVDKINEQVTRNETFSVTGKAEQSVALDTADISLGVMIEGESPIEVQQKASDAYSKAIDAVKNIEGIEEKDIKTQNYTIQPVRDTETNEVEGYRIELGLNITVRDTSPESLIVSRVINAGTENGFNQVNNLNFYLDDYDEAVDQIKNQAIEDAKQRAEEQASAAGLRLGKVINMYDNQGPMPYYYRGENSAAGVAMDSMEEQMPQIEIQPGETKVQSTVTLVYEIL